jgi:hypothetical protein
MSASATQDSTDKSDKAVAPAVPDNSVPWPSPPANTASAAGSASAGQDQLASTDNGDAGLPAADPIAGPIPLPRHRPNVFAMAETGAVPLPRARPVSAPDVAPTTSNDVTPYDSGMQHY